MKFAIVSQNANPGITIFRKDLINSLSSAGHTIYAFATDYTAETEEETKKIGAIPVKYSLSRTGMNPFQDSIDIFKLSIQLKKIKPDTILSSFIKPSIYATLAATLARVPNRYAMLEGLGYIYTLTPEGFSLKKQILQFAQGILARFSYRYAKKVIFLNNDDYHDLSKYCKIKPEQICRINGIGVNLSEFPYTPVAIKNCIRFIFVGRLLNEKGIREYVDAAKKVKKKHPKHVEFIVVGGLDEANPSGISKNELKNLIKDGVIDYKGKVSNISDHLKTSHIFVLPSYREGMPRSTQEAMAIGRAIITTDVPGCKDTVINSYNGYVVPPWDSESLAERMIHLIENPEKIKLMGKNSRSLAEEKFNSTVINKYLTSVLTTNSQAK